MKKNESKEIKFTDTNKSKKITFFSRNKRSIFNVESYGEFLLEKTSVAIKYFLLLVLIISLVLAAVSTYHFGKIVEKGYSYIKNELPDFTYENEKVKFTNSVEGYDKDIDLYSIINTDSEISDGVKDSYKEKVKDYSHAIIFLQDKILILENGQFLEYSYSQIENSYNVDIKNKEDLIQVLDTIGMSGINVTYFVVATLSLYIANIITYISDILMICIFGYLTGKIVGLPLNIGKTLILSIYSLTLSILLSTIYSVVYSLTGFVIEYFNIMYLLIAYIYIVAAILIIKSDLIKQHMELQKIYKVEAQVKKELEEQREKDKDEEDKKEEKKKEKDKKEEDDEPVINREPDGSEI